MTGKPEVGFFRVKLTRNALLAEVGRAPAVQMFGSGKLGSVSLAVPRPQPGFEAETKEGLALYR